MNKKKFFISLNLKISLVIMAGLLLTVVTYGMCTWLEHYVTETRYTSDAAVEKNIGEAYDSLEQYIKEENVKATDREALSKWLKRHEYTYFFVYDNYRNYFDAGWWSDPNSKNGDGEGTDDGQMLYDNLNNGEEGRIDAKTFPSDTKNRIIQFKDKKCYVFIDQYKEQHWQNVMRLVTLCLCFLTFLITILVYNGRLMKRILLLSSEVKRVSDGELDYHIHARHFDEIGELADAVDDMRTSIIEKHNNERAAWEANAQLITAMSHDVRTPLTSMIGYLDIIEGKKYENQAQLDKYISSCREKAFQLKDLSDKLFQYFLVFGNNETNKDMERYDASILFEQLLSEHAAEIIGYGYKVNFEYAIPEVDVMVDLSSARRLFDNIFSNLMKYASKRDPVGISALADDKNIQIVISNIIAENAKKVESTRIGLKTCEKICSDLKGSFTYEETDHEFTAKVVMPVAPPEVKPEEPEETGELSEPDTETASDTTAEVDSETAGTPDVSPEQEQEPDAMSDVQLQAEPEREAKPAEPSSKPQAPNPDEIYIG